MDHYFIFVLLSCCAVECLVVQARGESSSRQALQRWRVANNYRLSGGKMHSLGKRFSVSTEEFYPWNGKRMSPIQKVVDPGQGLHTFFGKRGIGSLWTQPYGSRRFNFWE